MKVAILCGNHGTFCAGADLKAVSSGNNRNQIETDGVENAPMGPSRF